MFPQSHRDCPEATSQSRWNCASELFATTTQARGCRQQQRQARLAEAHKMLSEVYNWFTEGFDTKDLQEAKALLDSLASNV